MSTNSTTLASYEQGAEVYGQTTRSDVTGSMQRFIDQSFTGVPKAAKVLEIGSATGRDAKYLQGQGFTNVTPTDAVESFVKGLQAQGLQAVKLNALSDALPPCDVLYANAVVHHFSRSEAREFFLKAYTALSEGGRLIFTTKRGEGEGWSTAVLGEPRHYTYWEPEPLAKELEEVEFALVTVSLTEDEARGVTWLNVVAIK